MKVLLFFIFLTVNSGNTNPAKECLTAENITAIELFDFFTKELSTAAESMPNLKCYAACCLEGMNALDGCTFQIESGKKYAVEKGLDDWLPAYDACHNSSISSERCECGYEVYKCVMEYIVHNFK